jgi:hypothetical protein
LIVLGLDFSRRKGTLPLLAAEGDTAVANPQPPPSGCKGDPPARPSQHPGRKLQVSGRRRAGPLLSLHRLPTCRHRDPVGQRPVALSHRPSNYPRRRATLGKSVPLTA